MIVWIKMWKKDETFPFLNLLNLFFGKMEFFDTGN